MTRRLLDLALVSILAVECTAILPADAPRRPWSEHTLCTIDLPDEFAGVLRVALDAWQVDWRVTSDTSDAWLARNADRLPHDCVPVYVVPDAQTAAWPDQRVAQTRLLEVTREPVAIELSLVWWEDCPAARWLTLLHEVGHAVGHREHTAAGVMAPQVDCLPAGDLIPTDAEIETARRARAGL